MLSSHLTGEMAATADDIVVVGQGRLLAAGSVGELTGSGGSLEAVFLHLG
ncbi:hypothetical protein AB0G04_09160 [Actinoplanes sp. NPDC023801]